MYIIEIDGSFHELPKQIKKDIRYRAMGYKVFRIKAYHNESALKIIKEIKHLIDNYIKSQNSTFF